MNARALLLGRLSRGLAYLYFGLLLLGYAGQVNAIWRCVGDPVHSDPVSACQNQFPAQNCMQVSSCNPEGTVCTVVGYSGSCVIFNAYYHTAGFVDDCASQPGFHPAMSSGGYQVCQNPLDENDCPATHPYYTPATDDQANDASCSDVPPDNGGGGGDPAEPGGQDGEGDTPVKPGTGEPDSGGSQGGGDSGNDYGKNPAPTPYSEQPTDPLNPDAGTTGSFEWGDFAPGETPDRDLATIMQAWEDGFNNAPIITAVKNIQGVGDPTGSCSAWVVDGGSIIGIHTITIHCETWDALSASGVLQAVMLVAWSFGAVRLFLMA